jgi:hypothetical protein
MLPEKDILCPYTGFSKSCFDGVVNGKVPEVDSHHGHRSANRHGREPLRLFGFILAVTSH